AGIDQCAGRTSRRADCDRSTPTPGTTAMRKYRSFLVGFANASYPIPCCPSRSAPVREKSARCGRSWANAHASPPTSTVSQESQIVLCTKMNCKTRGTRPMASVLKKSVGILSHGGELGDHLSVVE